MAWVILPGDVAQGQVTTTSIADTVYRADGTAAGGSLLVSWPAFTTATGQSVPAGRVEITIGGGGSVNFGLAPNSNAQPQGTYYTVVYHLDDGTVSTEYWSVPQGLTTTIAAVRSTVVPATVAVQSATVSFVNSTLSGYLPLAGGTLNGPLYMQGDPVGNEQAATKHYVDNSLGGITGGLSGKLALQPSASQTVIQPLGTTLVVSGLENMQYAAPNQTGAGNNGIANSLGQAGCAAGGCIAVADPGYATTEEPQGHPFPACFGGEPGAGDGDYCGYQWPINSRLWDQRAGTDIWSYSNPINYFGGLGRTHPLNYPGTPSSDASVADWHIFDFDADYGNGQIIPQSVLTHQFAGGHNGNYPSLGGFGKTNVIGTVFKTVNFSQGQHSIAEFDNYCLGVGDCMGAPVHIIYASGMHANSDEGIHTGDHWINEDANVFLGPCTGSGCTTGSTAILACATSGGNTGCLGTTGGRGQGDQGEGRFAIDISQVSGGNLGTVTGSGQTAQGTGQITGVVSASGVIPAQFTAPSGTFTPSTGLATLTGSLAAPAGSGMPGVQTVAVTMTSGTFVAGSTVCIADYGAQEQASVSAVGSGTITASFRKPHMAGALVAQGGTCGYLITLNADTYNPGGTPYRMAIPMMGSPSSTNTYYYYAAGIYAGFITAGEQTASPLSTAWNYYTHSASTSYNSTTGLVTVTGCCGFSTGINGAQGGGVLGNISGETVTITGATTATGASDTNYNGSYAATVTGENSFTYTPSAAPTSTSLTGLTLTFCNCTFTMYPGAEVLGVYNSTTKTVDGTLTLGANTVAWTAGDLVEEPHWYMPYVNDTHNNIGMSTPQYASPYGRGYYYDGAVSGQLRGFQLNNDGALSQYFGHGGNHVPPQTVFYTSGLWSTWATMLNAPESSLVTVGCKASSPAGNDGCTRWDAAYSVFSLSNSSGGNSYENYDPSNINWTYQFNSNDTSTYLRIGKNANGTTSGVALSGGAVSLFTPSLTLNGGTALTGQSGTGTSVVTNTGPSISGPTLNGTTNVPAGQTLTVAGTLNVTGSCTGCGAGAAVGSSTTGQLLVNSSGAIGGVSTTGTGNAVLAASPALTGTATLAGVTATGSAAINTSGSAATNIGNTSSTTNLAGSVNINTTGTGTTSSIGNTGSVVSLNGYVAVGGNNFALNTNASLYGNLVQGSTGTATSSATHDNSYTVYFDGSVWGGSTACTPGLSQTWVINSPTSWALTYGGVGHTTCAGVTPVITENLLTFPDGVQLVHILSADESGKTTTIAAGAGAGTSPTVSLTSGTDLKGTINVTTGTTPTASSVVATITFGTAYQSGPVCLVTPASASAMGTTYSPAAVAASFTINTGATALAASTSYSYSYSCLN
jgi:hypothetical protein